VGHVFVPLCMYINFQKLFKNCENCAVSLYWQYWNVDYGLFCTVCLCKRNLNCVCGCELFQQNPSIKLVRPSYYWGEWTSLGEQITWYVTIHSPHWPTQPSTINGYQPLQPKCCHALQLGGKGKWLIYFLARDVVYTSRAYATMLVSVCVWLKCIGAL